MSEGPIKLESRLLTAAHALIWCGGIFGTALLFIHFFTIGYLPRFDVTSILSVLAGMAVLGLVLLVLQIALFFLPGGAAIVFAEAGVIPRVPARGDGPELDDAAMKTRRHALLSQVGGALIAAVVVVATIWVGVPDAATVLFTLGLIALIATYALAEIFKVTWFVAGWRTFLFHTLAYFFWWPLLSVLLLLPLQQPGIVNETMIIGIAGIALFIHMVTYSMQGESKKMQLTIFGAVAAMAIVFTPILTGSAQTVPRFLRFGMLPQTQLTITQQGCDIVRAANFGLQCVPVAGSKGPLYTVGPLAVWTRVGADVLVSRAGDLGFRSCPKFVIPNSEVLSMKDAAAPTRSANVTKTSSPSSDSCPSARSQAKTSTERPEAKPPAAAAPPKAAAD